MKGATSSRFDGVDRSMTSAYTMRVDINGNLNVVAGGGEIENNDKRDDANAFAELFTDINDYSSWLTKFVPEFAATQFSTFPISFVKDFHFPGGKVFGFKEVQFSDFKILPPRSLTRKHEGMIMLPLGGQIVQRRLFAFGT